MNDEQFNKMFSYMTERFDKIEAKLDQKADKKDIDNIYQILDSIMKRLEISEDERVKNINQKVKSTF